MSTISPALSSLVTVIRDNLQGHTDLTEATDVEACDRLQDIALDGDQVRACVVLACFDRSKYGSYLVEVKLIQQYSMVAKQFGGLKKIHLASARKERQMHTAGLVDQVTNLLHSAKMLSTFWDTDVKPALGSIFPSASSTIAGQLASAGRHLHAKLDMSKMQDSILAARSLCHGLVLDWMCDVETLLGILRQVAPELSSEVLAKLYSPQNRAIFLRLQDTTVFNRCVNGVGLLRKWADLIDQVNLYLAEGMRIDHDVKVKLHEGIGIAARFGDVSTAVRMITTEIPAIGNLVLRKKKVGPYSSL